MTKTTNFLSGQKECGILKMYSITVIALEAILRIVVLKIYEVSMINLLDKQGHIIKILTGLII